MVSYALQPRESQVSQSGFLGKASAMTVCERMNFTHGEAPNDLAVFADHPEGVMDQLLDRRTDLALKERLPDASIAQCCPR